MDISRFVFAYVLWLSIGPTVPQSTLNAKLPEIASLPFPVVSKFSKDGQNSVSCNHEIVSANPTVSNWTSPNFGLDDTYPGGVNCLLEISSTTPSWLQLQLDYFSLHSKDMVTVDKRVLGKLKKKGTIDSSPILKVPFSNTVAKFVNVENKVGPGFHITITEKKTACHQLINAGAAGSTGDISAPEGSNNAWVTKACEFWIRSPPGTKIKLGINDLKLPRANQCNKNAIYIDTVGDKAYGTSVRYCDHVEDFTKPIISYGNKMNVFFFSKKKSGRFNGTYTVI